MLWVRLSKNDVLNRPNIARKSKVKLRNPRNTKESLMLDTGVYRFEIDVCRVYTDCYTLKLE